MYIARASSVGHHDQTIARLQEGPEAVTLYGNHRPYIHDFFVRAVHEARQVMIVISGWDGLTTNGTAFTDIVDTLKNSLSAYTHGTLRKRIFDQLHRAIGPSEMSNYDSIVSNPLATRYVAKFRAMLKGPPLVDIRTSSLPG